MSIIIPIFRNILYYYQLIIFFYILTSWFPSIRTSPVGRAVGSICEPYLSIFRRIIPPLGMIDFSPIIALLILSMAMTGLSRLG